MDTPNNALMAASLVGRLQESFGLDETGNTAELDPTSLRYVIYDCDQRLTGSRSTDKHGRKHPYYHHGAKKCSVSRSIPKVAFEQQFIELLDDIVPDEKYEKLFRRLF